ncbi:MAG: hypothetical protein F6K61_01915 [Sphaerospermopsis sp. SIO1G1]|nr:hypothetical protein [Sphaerospermopsis sp. SIO1G1]
MQSKTGQDFGLTLILLFFSAGQCFYGWIKPSCASTPDNIISQEDEGLNFMYLNHSHLLESTTQNTQSDIHLQNTQADKRINSIEINKNISSFQVEDATKNVQPELIDLKPLDQLQLLAQKTEAEVKPVYKTQALTHSANFKIEHGEIRPMFSQSAIYLLGETTEVKESIDDQKKLTQEQVEEKKQNPALDSNEEQELRLRVRPRPEEELPIPSNQKPKKPFKPIGYLRGYAGYFHTDNIFSSNDDKITDGLFYTGLTLASAYFPITSSTYLNGSINGSVIRYVDQSQFDYNRLRFRAGIYQQISRQMYTELNFSNQKLFYARNGDFFSAGDRFLDENSISLSVGRRDNLTNKLSLNSFYRFRTNFSEPERRSKIINSLRLSLNYAIQKPLKVGLNYRFTFSDFTNRDREDQSHRIYGHINYRTSKTSNIYMQSGFRLGGSTTPNTDFSGWFFSVNYGFELGRF